MLKYLWLSRITLADLFLAHLVLHMHSLPHCSHISSDQDAEALRLRGSWTAVDPVAPPCSTLLMQKPCISSAMGPWISQTTDYELGRHQKSLEQSLNTAGVNYIELAVIFKE